MDIDKVLIDIMTKRDYERVLSTQYKKELNSKFKDNIKFIKIEQMELFKEKMQYTVANECYEEFVVVVRNDVKEFLKKLSKRYTFYVASRINQGLLSKLIDIIDPDSKHPSILYTIFKWM